MLNLPYTKLEKPDPNETVIRYTSLAQFIWILTLKELPLIRIDLFRDPFEGSAPQSLIDAQVIASGTRAMANQQYSVLRHHYPDHAADLPRHHTSGDLFTEMTVRRRARTYTTHASCWRWGSESEGMWRLYCGDKDGVAFQTTFTRLEKSVEESQILVGKVRYGNYKTMPAFNEDLDHMMYKREGFRFEQEVRLLTTDEVHYRKLCSGAEQVKLSSCLPIRWSVEGAVDRILVSPYADNWYMDAVLAVARLSDGDITDRIVWSELREQPQF